MDHEAWHCQILRLHVYIHGYPWKLILSPIWAPAGGSRISTFSGELAHITIAWLTTPLILAGFRLQHTMISLSCIWKIMMESYEASVNKGKASSSEIFGRVQFLPAKNGFCQANGKNWQKPVYASSCRFNRQQPAKTGKNRINRQLTYNIQANITNASSNTQRPPTV